MRLAHLAPLAAALSLALAGPAAASSTDFDATIDCGSGPVGVSSTPSLFAPLVDVTSGDRYKPVAWDVVVDGVRRQASKRTGSDKSLLRCAYDDGVAKGTVTVIAPKG